jgi:hypothetical protein
VHIDQLAGHPGQAAQAGKILDQMQMHMDRQRTYCALLERESERSAPKNGNAGVM